MLRRCWVEVKSVTLARGRQAQFPDAVTLRGRRHLAELRSAVAGGDEAVQVFLIQRGDCDSFSPAADIDPAYASALREAAEAGVKICAYRAGITKRGIEIERPIPVTL
jgi:sugar fermentation stimulation protein A